MFFYLNEVKNPTMFRNSNLMLPCSPDQSANSSRLNMCQRKFNDLVCHLSSTLQSTLTLNTKESSPCVLFTRRFISSISSVNVKGNDASNKRQHEGRRHVKLVATIFDGAVSQKLTKLSSSFWMRQHLLDPLCQSVSHLFGNLFLMIEFNIVRTLWQH